MAQQFFERGCALGFTSSVSACDPQTLNRVKDGLPFKPQDGLAKKGREPTHVVVKDLVFRSNALHTARLTPLAARGNPQLRRGRQSQLRKCLAGGGRHCDGLGLDGLRFVGFRLIEGFCPQSVAVRHAQALVAGRLSIFEEEGIEVR